MTPLPGPKTPSRPELEIQTVTPNPAALGGCAGLAMSQGSPEHDPAKVLWRKVIPGGGREADADCGDDEALADD